MLNGFQPTFVGWPQEPQTQIPSLQRAEMFESMQLCQYEQILPVCKNGLKGPRMLLNKLGNPCLF
jgi:hypothetical protein